jgi:hypothetical protein
MGTFLLALGVFAMLALVEECCPSIGLSDDHDD